jgi:hypothetical protein
MLSLFLKGGVKEMKIGTSLIGRSIVFFIAYVLLSGCASMLAPNSDNITIKTNPEGADVYYGTHLLGKTPLTYSFHRDTFERKILNIRKKGYKNQELLLEKTLEGKALWNLAFFITTMGVTSWGIDAANGNMIKYSPDSYLIDLERDDNSSRQKDHGHLQRLRFVASNQDNLKKDIAIGDGEYLRAYFASKPSWTAFNNYQDFLSHVSHQAPLLLSLHDPVEFYNCLENI